MCIPPQKNDSNESFEKQTAVINLKRLYRICLSNSKHPQMVASTRFIMSKFSAVCLVSLPVATDKVNSNVMHYVCVHCMVMPFLHSFQSSPLLASENKIEFFALDLRINK